jgi:predicted nucleotidyltransferase
MANPNIELLTRIAEALGELREQMVFVGGCATGLLLTDAAAAPVRATQDVDAIVAIVSLRDYHRLGEALRSKGFSQTPAEGEPPYRWTFASMKLDVMPTDPTVLGFSNRWYEPALTTAVVTKLTEGVTIRLVKSDYFIATKLEAFLDRGQGDYLVSHDLEDVLSVVDGRPELVEEIMQATPELRAYVAGVIGRLLEDEGFLNALPGLVIEGSPADRTPVVLQRLRALARLNEDT